MRLSFSDPNAFNQSSSRQVALGEQWRQTFPYGFLRRNYGRQEVGSLSYFGSQV